MEQVLLRKILLVSEKNFKEVDVLYYQSTRNSQSQKRLIFLINT